MLALRGRGRFTNRPYVGVNGTDISRIGRDKICVGIAGRNRVGNGDIHPVGAVREPPGLTGWGRQALRDGGVTIARWDGRRSCPGGARVMPDCSRVRVVYRLSGCLRVNWTGRGRFTNRPYVGGCRRSGLLGTPVRYRSRTGGGAGLKLDPAPSSGVKPSSVLARSMLNIFQWLSDVA